MSAFCVFGVSRQDCKRIAERKVPTKDPKTKKGLSPQEWRQRVDEMAEELFVSRHDARQISPTFDAPQFSREWLELAQMGGQVKATSLRVRTPKTDSEGKPIKRNGKLLMTWAVYPAESGAQHA